MRTSLHLRLGLLPVLAALSACSSFVEGNGVHAVRVLDASTGLPEFSSAAVGLPGDVDVSGHPPSATIHARAQERRVELSGDENVIEHIKVQVDASGRLFMSIDVDGYSSVHPPVLVVHAAGLAGVEALGGSDVAVHDAPAGDFSVTGSAGSHLVVDGTGGRALTVVLSGGAQLDAAPYPVHEALLTLSGASRATIWPEHPPTGTAAGGSTVLVKGGAACAMDVSGGSSCGPLH